MDVPKYGFADDPVGVILASSTHVLVPAFQRKRNAELSIMLPHAMSCPFPEMLTELAKYPRLVVELGESVIISTHDVPFHLNTYGVAIVIEPY